MSMPLLENFPNPYVSPRSAVTPVAAPAVQPIRPGSIGITVGGFVLLLLGYFASNLFVISDLYHIGFGPDGKVIPSPLASIASTAPQQWMLYAACAAAFVTGAVMIGSQSFNPLVAVCYIICPVVGIIYLVATPLRIVKKYAEPVAALYLLVGSCLVITGATQLLRLYGHATGGFAPVAASMMTEAGLAIVVGSALKFLVSGSPTISAEEAEPIVVAEFADGIAPPS
jgi:hypothetical protein